MKVDWKNTLYNVIYSIKKYRKKEIEQKIKEPEKSESNSSKGNIIDIYR